MPSVSVDIEDIGVVEVHVSLRLACIVVATKDDD
jgi:hypothetical protein